MRTSSRKARRQIVRLDEVAYEAGVSPKTASLALRGDSSVSTETAESVRRASSRLGYKPRRGAKRTFGLIVPYLIHPYDQLVGSIRRLASSYDKVTLIGESEGHPRDERTLIREFSRRGIDGLVFIGPRLSADEIDIISRQGPPVITVNTPVPDNSSVQFGSVEIDNEAGAYAAVKYLIERGHRRIAYLAGRRPSASDQQRRQGYSY